MSFLSRFADFFRPAPKRFAKLAKTSADARVFWKISKIAA
jgi:hypothetical protein